VKAFISLRRIATMLIYFCKILFLNIPELSSEQIEKWFSESFMLSKTENESIQWIKDHLNQGKSIKTNLKDFQHNLIH
jgi:hypothetical protein